MARTHTYYLKGKKYTYETCDKESEIEFGTEKEIRAAEKLYHLLPGGCGVILPKTKELGRYGGKEAYVTTKFEKWRHFRGEGKSRTSAWLEIGHVRVRKWKSPATHGAVNPKDPDGKPLTLLNVTCGSLMECVIQLRKEMKKAGISPCHPRRKYVRG